MLCIAPYKPGKPGIEYGCGQCMPCRINRKRMWTARLMLESSSVYDSRFVTLTYDPAELPTTDNGLPELRPDHLRKLTKDLRRLYGPFRYYFVGEYGDRTFRPHYHGILFSSSIDADQLTRVWDKGNCQVGNISIEGCAYVAGYCTKKMTGSEDPRLKGRHPEFARMSNRPGIGVLGIEGVVNWMRTPDGNDYIARTADVVKSIRINGKVYPLGNYITRYLREQMGVDPHSYARFTVKQAEIEARGAPELSQLRDMQREGSYQRGMAMASLRRSLQTL
ncbi:MAG: replication initiator protein [Microvirus sp.]|nr:MAG: replication initiator protein [Microvirus sp.]